MTASPITLELSAVLLGSTPNFSTPWERRIANLVWGVQEVLDLPPATGGFLQFFCGVEIIKLQHRLSPRGETQTSFHQRYQSAHGKSAV